MVLIIVEKLKMVYIGLVCKAADAGYKVVILLTGITETLRQQTQERVEEGILGYTIRSFGKGKNKHKSSTRVGVGLDNMELKASAFTSYEDDFKGDVVFSRTPRAIMINFKGISIFTVLRLSNIFKCIKINF